MRTDEAIAAVAGHEARLAGSDAERRAARALAVALRRGGRRATRVHTWWGRPGWAAARAVPVALAVAASVVSVDHAGTGAALAAAALLLFVADLSGLAPLRLLTFQRATQDVVSPDPRGDDARVRLVLTAGVDAPRRALLRHVPAAHAVALGALVLLVACTVWRSASEDPPGALGVVQLIPTVLLLVMLALLFDAGAATASGPASGTATAPAAVLAMAAALDRRPPRNLAVDVVLPGAAQAEALGMRRWVAAQRRAGRRAEEVAVLHVEACGAGTPVWWTREGRVLRLRYHPRLVALAEGVARDEGALAARPVASWTMSGARRARAWGWPAIAIGARPQDAPVPADAVVDHDAVAATVAFGLALVAALDRDLDANPVAPGPVGARTSRP